MSVFIFKQIAGNAGSLTLQLYVDAEIRLHQVMGVYRNHAVGRFYPCQRNGRCYSYKLDNLCWQGLVVYSVIRIRGPDVRFSSVF